MRCPRPSRPSPAPTHSPARPARHDGGEEIDRSLINNNKRGAGTKAEDGDGSEGNVASRSDSPQSSFGIPIDGAPAFGRARGREGEMQA